ncbi:MAG: hypothetical protein R3240_12250 [Gammaproteobacteria bacterium]|nr:hypothetical protein [Gammaproteobacteria bacterium]
MGFMQWFWKYGYFIVPLIIALAWFISSDKYQNRNNINPGVFAYFKQVDKQCQAESFDQRSAACLQIEKFEKDCLKVSVSCDSQKHYDLLLKLGYQPPPYYQ